MHYIYEFNLIKIVALHFHIWLTIIEIQGEVPILRTGGLPWTTPKEDPARRPCFLYFRLAVTHSVWNLSSCLRKHIVNGAETSCNICTYQDQWSGQLADFVEIAGKKIDQSEDLKVGSCSCQGFMFSSNNLCRKSWKRCGAFGPVKPVPWWDYWGSTNHTQLIRCVASRYIHL